MATKVPIGDVNDAEGFVRSFLPHNVILTPEARADLVQTGLTILVEMFSKYEPGRGGQDPTTSRFSGYAAKYLPSKLRDAWHRQEGHTLSTGDNGKRRWSYPDKPVSLDEMQERDGHLDNIQALQADDRIEQDLEMNLHRAIREHHEQIEEVTVQAGLLLAEDHSPAAVAEKLGLREREVRDALELLRTVAPKIHTMEAV